MFDVRLVPVYAKLEAEGKRSFQAIPGKRGVLNCEANRVISVVSDSYQLISNARALEYGRQCCEQAFPDVSRADWEVVSADAPKSTGHCHIDLGHKSADLTFGFGDSDVYWPYVRVTNSYNLQRALGFDIGLVRKVCTNGMIVTESSVRFSYNHNTRRIPERIEFDISQDHFRNLKDRFVRFLRPLRECGVSLGDFSPIVKSALDIREPSGKSLRNDRIQRQWRDTEANISALCVRYTSELGPTAYALLNVITDIASRPAEAGLARRERNSLQKKAGSWLASFSAECKKPGFTVSAYVRDVQAATQANNERLNRGRANRASLLG